MRNAYTPKHPFHTTSFEPAADDRVGAFTALYLVFLIILGITGYTIGRDRVIDYTTVKLNAPTSQRLPTLSLNMHASGAQAGAVKFSFSLEVAQKDTKRVQGFMPIIMDRVQTVLNETPIEQLKSKTDLHFVRENMLSQINLATSPVHVTNLYIDKLITSN